MQRKDYYAGNDKMYVATDCIVFGYSTDSLQLLIFPRKIEPHKGEWSLIGSFVKEDEHVRDAAERVLKEITGLDKVFFEQLKTYGDVDRDPGARCISVAQYALIRLGETDRRLVEEHGAYWYKLEDLPSLVLDHDKLVRDALKELRRKARYQPIGFELLPEKFTLPQLINLYEVIYQKKLDPRNFRKKILSLKVLTKLDEKDKSTSKKGAYLYKFNREKYHQLLESGYHFEL